MRQLVSFERRVQAENIYHIDFQCSFFFKVPPGMGIYYTGKSVNKLL
jgi:hypothetical protein